MFDGILPGVLVEGVEATSTYLCKKVPHFWPIRRPYAICRGAIRTLDRCFTPSSSLTRKLRPCVLKGTNSRSIRNNRVGFYQQ